MAHHSVTRRNKVVMNTFSIELKSGKKLFIPAEYYPRYADIMVTKENLFSLTPITRLEAFLKAIGQHIFSPVYSILSIINLSLCAPILVRNYQDNQETTYYFCLCLGFIVSYIFTKFYFRLTQKDPMSIDSVAKKLGYKASSSPLKPYDERMLKEIIVLNNIQIRRQSLFFDDLYGILFDVPTPRRLQDAHCHYLKVIK